MKGFALQRGKVVLAKQIPQFKVMLKIISDISAVLPVAPGFFHGSGSLCHNPLEATSCLVQILLSLQCPALEVRESGRQRTNKTPLCCFLGLLRRIGAQGSPCLCARAKVEGKALPNLHHSFSLLCFTGFLAAKARLFVLFCFPCSY